MRKFVMLFAVLAACSEAADRPQSLPETTVELGGAKVLAQVADDDKERATGLMFVKSMPQDKGMLFVWPDAVERNFWMRNTYIPLDLIFIRDGKVVSVAADARPFDETGLASGGAANMVLEVNAGWAKTHGVAVGDAVIVK